MAGFVPQTCANCGPGGTTTEYDVEGTLLCDVLDGETVGSALVQATYDETTGLRTGTTVVDPVTGAPYVVQGVLQPCVGSGGGASGDVVVTNEVEVKNDAGNPLTVDGTVALDAATLAALDFPTSMEVSNDVGSPLTVDTQLDQALTLAQLLLQLPLLIDQVGGANFDKITATGTVTPGSPLVVAPAPGFRLRVWYILGDYSPDDPSTGRLTATLVGKGEIYRCFGVGHRQRFDGDVDGTLTIACTAGTYEATVHYEEVL